MPSTHIKKTNKKYLLLVMLALCSNALAKKELQLIGYDQMINELKSVIVTDKTYFKERLKNGAPKYLHQITDEFYYMQVIPSGHYTLTLNPAEWFDIERLEKDKFKIRITNPMDMYGKHNTEEFNISWKIDEDVYCDECEMSQFVSKYKSEPGLPKVATPFKLLGFDQMMKEFYAVADTNDIQLNTKNEKNRPNYLHQLKDEVYTLIISEPGDYALKLKPESWFEITQSKGNVFRVKFIEPVKIRRKEYDENFTVDWQVDELTY